ncbi:regulator of chromosome condensation 1/beta-lactamase-inhibitor protein II [Limtongia smithiae]|uniref:regulator of chromosome condensation 1/beta-lactamase-inhibitor protein II n=1 Tax=Limtongia smithiae TaxID=1125753 RepID=UPI0034CDFCF4
MQTNDGDAVHTLDVYSLGSNSRCQLGHPSAEDVYHPTLVDFATPIPPIPTRALGDIEIVSNGNHTLLRVDGVVYAAGDNTYGQCFVSPEIHGDVVRRFMKVQVIDWDADAWRVTHVAAGWEFSIAVVENDDQQRVYVAGYGLRGELGLGEGVLRSSRSNDDGTTARQLPEFPPAGRRIVQLVAGMSHALVLLNTGEVYGWGSARRGELGDGHRGVVALWTPRLISFTIDDNSAIPLSQVACGRSFSCAIDSRGRVIVLGGSKGHGNAMTVVPDASRVSTWTQLQSGWSTVHVLLASGEVVSWGSDTHGQRCPPGVRLSRMACGSEHVVGIDATSGKVMAWGWSEHGNCGVQADAVREARAIDDACGTRRGRVVYVGAGCATTWLVCT